jgi:glycerol-3-phosphate dehydrogenase subunit B
MTLARLFDTPAFRQEVAEAVKPHLGSAARVGFPAVLGLQQPAEACRHLESLLGRPVFEMPGLPPSIPGLRLHNLLVQAIQRLGGQVYDGIQAVGAECAEQQVQVIWSEAAARRKAQRAAHYVLATGGILGGGLVAHEQGVLQETVLGLPLHAPAERDAWFRPEFCAGSGHPIFSAGISVNADFQPVDEHLQPRYRNLFAAGGLLGGCDPLRERSLEGVALISGYVIGQRLSHA